MGKRQLGEHAFAWIDPVAFLDSRGQGERSFVAFFAFPTRAFRTGVEHIGTAAVLCESLIYLLGAFCAILRIPLDGWRCTVFVHECNSEVQRATVRAHVLSVSHRLGRLVWNLFCAAWQGYADKLKEQGMEKINLEGEDISKIRRQQFEVILSSSIRSLVLFPALSATVAC